MTRIIDTDFKKGEIADKCDDTRKIVFAIIGGVEYIKGQDQLIQIVDALKRNIREKFEKEVEEKIAAKLK